jgi:beta-galactosidase
VRVLHAGALHGQEAAELAERHPVLVVAGLYVADDALLDLLAAYAEHGGHLVLGVRTGYADEAGVVRPEAGPPRLTGAAGVRYQEFSNLAAPVPVSSASDGPLALPSSATATRWVDGLEVLDAQVLAGYDDPHFGRWPAITTRAHGRGRVTYVSTVPDEALARSLASWLVPQPVAGWGDVPATATVTSGRSAAGERLWFAHNWSWQPCTIPSHPAVRDVLSGEQLPAGSGVSLGAWDVRVFVAADAPADGE